MRAIILAGGYAKRLLPLTAERPKPLLPIGDGTILDFIMAKMRHLELSEIMISTNKRFEPNFYEWLKKRNYPNVKIFPEPSTKEEEKLGPIKAISIILKDAHEDDYLITAGDNLFSLDLQKMYAYFEQVKKPVVALYEISSYSLAKQYACVEMEKDFRIVGFEEKPCAPKSLLVSTGIYMLPWSSMRRIDDYLAAGNPPDPVGQFICWLTQTEEVHGYPFSGYWYDIGSLDSYREAQADFMNRSYKTWPS